MASERGQATVEWTGTTLLVALAFVALIASVPAMGGSSLGRVLEERIVCAVEGSACGVRVASARPGTVAAASVRAVSAGLFDDPWLPALNWKRSVTRDKARVVAYRLRDGQRVVAALELVVGGRLPKKLVAAIVAASGITFENWAREIDGAIFKSRPGQQVCVHVGGRLRNPPSPLAPTYPDVTSWVRKGARC
ncbi:MAG: hypothetical protein H0V29_09130 [Thermoleophilaceae bacterium]|nr:hypothetical protein [Thermoleophilaceae bacterium]